MNIYEVSLNDASEEAAFLAFMARLRTAKVRNVSQEKTVSFESLSPEMQANIKHAIAHGEKELDWESVEKSFKHLFGKKG